jgi:hypothetical protein
MKTETLETVQEKEYKRLYLKKSAQKDELTAIVQSAIRQLESGVMSEQVAQQLRNAIQ